MPSPKNPLFIFAKILLAGVIAVISVFFFSILAGADLVNINATVADLDKISIVLKNELDSEIDKKITALGDVPAIEPYKKLYCDDLAGVILEIFFTAEKQKIIFDTHNPNYYETKSASLLLNASESDLDSLLRELEIAKSEIVNAMNLCEKRLKKLSIQRIAYILFFLIVWVVLYLFLFYRHDRKT